SSWSPGCSAIGCQRGSIYNCTNMSGPPSSAECEVGQCAPIDVDRLLFACYRWRAKLAQILIHLLVFAALAGCGPAQTRIDPEASQKQYLLGADYFNKGLVGPALEELLKAVQLDPNNPDAHNLLGLVFLRKAAESDELASRSQCLKGEELRLEKQEMDG